MIRTSSLFAAFVLFFWMFLAADPLEQLAGRDRFRPASHDTRELALTHAALWRHGMAGNSPLYMPGFFAVAVAAWSWAGGAGARGRRPSRMLMEGAVFLVLAAIAATTGLAAGGATIVESFEGQFALRHEGFLPAPSLRATMLAAYTLCTWTIFVFCCRRALASRSWRLLWPVPPMTLVLTLVRTWTLGDVWHIWGARLAEGDRDAVLSSLAIPMVVGWMLRTELTSSRPRAAAPAPADGDARRKSAPGRLSGQPR